MIQQSLKAFETAQAYHQGQTYDDYECIYHLMDVFGSIVESADFIEEVIPWHTR
jgi:hypothetical protein